MIIDTHTHIYLEEFDSDRKEVIQRAKNNHIVHMILPGVDSSCLKQMLNLEAKNPCYFSASIGLHPSSVGKNYQKELNIVEAELNRRKYCAVGEIGLDKYWTTEFYQEQIIVFEKQLQWAKERNLPVLIHARSAIKEAINSIKKIGNTIGIFHCFEGSLQEAEEITALGNFKLGVNGICTYKKSTIASILENIPLKNLVLETDAPYLAPIPNRGKRNEPANLIYIVQKLSEIYKLPAEEIENQTSKNSLNIFKHIKID